MGSALIDQLVTLIDAAPITAPLHIDINGTVVKFPVPTIEFPELGTKKSVATFPSGPPGVADLVSHATAAAADTMNGSVPAFGELSPPLNDFAKMSINQLWVRFSSNGWYPIAVGVELAYHGTPPTFQDTSIDDMTLTVEVVMPADADLFGVTAWASAKLDLPGHQTIDVTIDSGGEVTFVIDQGQPVPLDRILDLFKAGVPALKFPRLEPTPSAVQPTPAPSQPALREPTVRYQVGSNEFSISAGFDDVGVSVLHCSLSLDRLFIDVGPSPAANVLVHGAVGPVMFIGFLDTSGDVQIKGHLPALKAADLVGAAFPEHAVSQAWDKVQLAAGELTLSRATGGVDTIEFSTVCTPAAALTGAQVKFLKHLDIDVGASSFATTVVLQSEPKLAQLEVELLTPTPQPTGTPANSPPAITDLWFRITVADTLVTVGLTAGLSWVCQHERVTLAGAVTFDESSAAIDARLVSPSPWRDALGVTGLEVSGLSGTVGVTTEGGPTFGFTGVFSVPAPGQRSPFEGAVAVLFNGGDPARNVFMLAFNHLDLGEVFQVFCAADPNSPLLGLLRQIHFDNCMFCYSPDGFAVGPGDTFVASLDQVFGAQVGDPFAAGLVAKGSATMFGWTVDLDCEIDQTRGITFDVDMETAIRIAGVFDLCRDAHHPKLGPTLHFTTYPSPPDPILAAAGAVEIPGIFQASADVLFDETRFHLDATATFFKTEQVTLSVHAEFGQVTDASVMATASLNSLEDHSTRLAEMLSASTSAAAKALGDAQAALRAEQQRLQPLKDTFKANQRLLDQKIHERDRTILPIALEAEVIGLTNLVAAERAAYTAASGVLTGLENGLAAISTPFNIASALLHIKAAQRAADVPLVELRSVRCTAKASQLTQPKFTADVEVDVLGVRHSLKSAVDFDADDCIDALLHDLVGQITELYIGLSGP